MDDSSPPSVRPIKHGSVNVLYAARLGSRNLAPLTSTGPKTGRQCGECSASCLGECSASCPGECSASCRRALGVLAVRPVLALTDRLGRVGGSGRKRWRPIDASSPASPHSHSHVGGRHEPGRDGHAHRPSSIGLSPPSPTSLTNWAAANAGFFGAEESVPIEIGGLEDPTGHESRAATGHTGRRHRWLRRPRAVSLGCSSGELVSNERCAAVIATRLSSEPGK